MANLSPISLSGTLPTVSGDSSMAALEGEDQGFVQELQGALEQQSGATATRAQTLDAESDAPDKSSQDESDQQNLPSNAWAMVNPSAIFAGAAWTGQLEQTVQGTNPASADAVVQMEAGLVQMAGVTSSNMGPSGGVDTMTSTVSSSPLAISGLQSSATAASVSTAAASAQDTAGMVVNDVAMPQATSGLHLTQDQALDVGQDAIVRAESDATSSAVMVATQDKAPQINANVMSPQGDQVTRSEANPSAIALSSSALPASKESAGVGTIAHQANESVLQVDASSDSLSLALMNAAHDTSESKSIQSQAGTSPGRVAEVDQVLPAVAKVQQIEATDVAQPAVDVGGAASKTADGGEGGPQASALPLPNAMTASAVNQSPIKFTTSPAQMQANLALNSNETNAQATMVSGQTGEDTMLSANAIKTPATPAEEVASSLHPKSNGAGIEGPAPQVMAASSHAVTDLQASTSRTASPLDPLSPPMQAHVAAEMTAAGAVQTPRAQGLDQGQEVARQEADRWSTEATPSGNTSPAFNLFSTPAQDVKEVAHTIDASRAGGSGASLAAVTSERAPSVDLLQAASADVSADNSASGTDSSFTHSFMQTLMGHNPAASALAEHRVLEPDVTPSALAPHQVQLDAGPVHVEIVRLVKQGGGQVVLALTPPDQTTFKIDLSIDAQGLARLVVDGGSDSTRSRLEQGVTQLQEQFTQMGLQLQFDMRQSRDDTRAQDQAWASGHSGGAPVEVSPAKPDAITRPRSAPASWAQGQVHLYA